METDAMATSKYTTRTRTQTPAPKAYYAHLYDQPCILATDADGRIVILNDQYDVIMDYEIPMAPFVTILGQVGIAATQRIMDHMHGGYAMIACTRLQEVQ